MKVDVNELRKHKEAINKINRMFLSEITWIEDGKEVDICSERLNEFKFTGLNNVDFIMTGEYLEKGPVEYNKEN